MNWADAVIIVVILISILIGVLRGFTRELLGTLAWVLAFWVAFSFSDDAARLLAAHIETPSVRRAAAFGGLFLLTLLVASICAYFVAKLMQESKLAGVDRTLGGGFGFLRGALIVAALMMIAEATPAKDDAWWQQSFCIQHLSWTADALRSVTPKSWIAAIESHDENAVPIPPPTEPTEPARPGKPAKPAQQPSKLSH